MSGAHEWMDRAACRYVYGFTEKEPDEAKKYCASCPVVEPCTQHLKSFKGLNDLVILGVTVVYGGMTPREVAGLDIKCIHGRRPSCDICTWRRELVKVAEDWSGDMNGLADHLQRPISTVRQSLRRWSPEAYLRIATRARRDLLAEESELAVR